MSTLPKESSTISTIDLSLGRTPAPTVSSARATDPTSGQQFRAALARSTASALAGVGGALAGVERMLPFAPGGVSMTTAVRGGASAATSTHLRSLEAVSGLSVSGLASGNLSPASEAMPTTPSTPIGPDALNTPSIVQPAPAPVPSTESLVHDSSTQALELIALQQQIGLEQRQFTTVSNVLKARHETVKNLIGNVR